MASSLLVLVGLACNAVAIAVLRDATPCPFSLKATGIENGIITQDSLGLPRVGGKFPQNTYHLKDSSLKDSFGNTCDIFDSDGQLQCSPGMPRSPTFTLSTDLYIQHNQNSKWLACPTAAGGYEVFTDARKSTSGCKAIQLLAENFGCDTLRQRNMIASAAETLGTDILATDTPSVSCPANIGSGPYEYPHLIVPTSSASPDHSFGNSNIAYISPINTTIFNFDIPSTAPYLGTCALVFQFPYKSQLAWNNQPNFYFSGIEQEQGMHGGLEFAERATYAVSTTTYNTIPPVLTDFGKTTILPGTNYTIATFPCNAGTTRGFSVSSVNGTEFDFFQDSRPAAVGPYIVPCA